VFLDVSHQLRAISALVLKHGLDLTAAHIPRNRGIVVGHADLEFFMTDVDQVLVHRGVH